MSNTTKQLCGNFFSITILRTAPESVLFRKHDSLRPKKKCCSVSIDVLSLGDVLSTSSHNENFVARENFRGRRGPRKLSRSVHVFAVGSLVRSLANSVLERSTREVLFRSTLTEKAFRVLGKRFYGSQMSRPRLINLHDRSL